MEGTNSGAEAERWLSIAERLLMARDLHGAKSFAVRVRDSDPRIRIESADQIIAVADTLLAGGTRTIKDQPDWYAILQLVRLTQNPEHIASQYRRLALLLNPAKNHLPFADQAFRLVCDAWSVLSNTFKKADYDNALSIYSASGSTQPLFFKQQPPMRRSPRSKDGEVVADEDSPNFNNITESSPQSRPIAEAARQDESSRKSQPARSESMNFWTACPYCYMLYEYPGVYEECTLRCQNCRRAFEAVRITSPPVTDKDTYFCCWGFFPLGISVNSTSGSSKWTPISPMFACPFQATGGPDRNVSKSKNKRVPWVYYDDKDALENISESSEDSDEEWGSDKWKRKAKKRASRGTDAKKGHNERQKKGRVNVGSGQILDASKAESSDKAAVAAGGAKKRGATELGKLDLNVEFNNEVEEPAREIDAGNGEEENIEGIGFFEGLDEFLSSLPILKG
ncbi:hypothetical protein CJ030_MR7G008272 [Morella rubra]|uniref:J domain-containing protein n=1 Tax=Morella rubra TaxID=262757 RepID=A0A6A1V279_9ROSI|nr:hypothetical protein CJ030_MR0G008293 [Morella rubra]KAB1206812.1 hypothetical protein CJ030_MR7G008272 [Morella rubra]